MTKSSHSHSKLKKGGSDEKLRKVRGVRPRQREIQDADIHQAWTLCQVHLTNIPRSSWSFRSFHKSDEYQYLEKYILWNTSSSQENCHSIHWHCGWVSNHQVATLSEWFARIGLHLLPVQGWQHCGCGQCYPHTLRHLWGRRPASLVSLQNFFMLLSIFHLGNHALLLQVWLCRLHEGTQWHCGGGKRVLCLRLQGDVSNNCTIFNLISQLHNVLQRYYTCRATTLLFSQRKESS